MDPSKDHGMGGLALDGTCPLATFACKWYCSFDYCSRAGRFFDAEKLFHYSDPETISLLSCFLLKHML